MTLTINITLEQGADYDTPIPLFDDAGDPEDFTGCTAVMQIGTQYGTTPLMTLSTADGTLTIEDGQIIPHITYSQVSAFAQGTYVADILVRRANGLIHKPRTILLTVDPTMTQVAPPNVSPPPPPPPPPPTGYGQFDFSNASNSGLAAGAM